MDNQLLKTPLKIIWNAYKKYVRGVILPDNNDALKDISYWRNKLFCNFIIYIIPITFIALVPGVCMSVLNGIPFLAIFDLVVFTIIVVIAVNRRLTLRGRKIIFISALYCLSIALLYFLSGSGVGVLYLLALTVITTVIFSLEAAYYSVLANLIICVIFGLLIHFGFNSTFFNNYTVGSLIAVLSNLITLSLICAVCLNMLIKGLEATIAERKKAEEIIVKERDLSNSIINSLPGIFYLFDETGRFLRWNKNFETVSGYSAAEISQLHPLNLFDADVKHLLENKIAEAFNSGTADIEALFLTKAKEKIPYYFNGWRVNYEGKTCLIGVGIDITERKNTEKKIEQQNKELAVSNTELEQFAYVASHDLQEPLRLVTSFMNLLEKRMGGQLDDTNKRYIHFAADGAMRMKTLIQNLLQYSRLGINKESFTATNLNEVMQYITRVLEEDIKKNRAVITVKPLPVIAANKALINQLFVNLITNALKYHNGKEPEIEVGSTEDKDWYIFYVKDNGIGIDPRFFDKIFIIFQRLHNKDEYSGTGIGLAICKKIVEIHKGKIWVESEAGKGSTFYFSIPKTSL